MKKIIIFSLVISIFLYILLSFNSKTINITYAEAKGTLTDNIDGIDDSRYPEFKRLIQNLRANHPNYKFYVYYTGLDWNEVLTTEYQGHNNEKNVSPKNLAPKSDKYSGMWECPICGETPKDNGSWYCASLDALAYMMDPRASLNESDLFQFKNLEQSDVTYDDIKRVVSGYGSFINNDEAIRAIVEASQQYNVNGYFLVAKIINEHGTTGSTLTAGNGYNGVNQGYYNYFNVGSYGNGNAEIIKNGLEYAKSKDWNSISKSIKGGAEIIKQNYITQYGQTTLYYQKFNVVGKTTVGAHQYQQNILAAQTQGTSLKQYYGTSTTPAEFQFIIPLYENMPQTKTTRPNATIKNSITYENGVVQNVTKSLIVRASANGTSIGALNNGEPIKILRRAPDQVAGYNWDLIVSNRDGTYGYSARVVGGDVCLASTGGTGTSSGGSSNYQPEPEPETPPVQELPEPPAIDLEKDIVIEGDYLDMLPSITYEHIKEKYPEALVKDSQGQEVSSGNLGTGYTVTIEDKEYKVVKKGDTDGDGEVTVIDAVLTLNAIKGNREFENEIKEAACVNNEETFTVVDAVLMLNYIKGTKFFSIE